MTYQAAIKMFTENKLRAQYRKNLASMKVFAEKARTTGKMVRGSSLKQWEDGVSRYEAIVAMSDEKLLSFIQANFPNKGIDPRTF